MPFYIDLPPPQIIDSLEANGVFNRYKAVPPALDTDEALETLQS